MKSFIMDQEQYLVHFQHNRDLYVRIALLNQNNIEIDKIEGVVIDGNINITNKGSIRRVCNLSMIVKDNTYLFGENKRIWLNRRIKIEIGILSERTDRIVWFNKGCYMIDSPSLKYDLQSKVLEFQGLDFMCELDGTLGGNLPNKVTINAGNDISNVIRDTAKILGKVDKLDIERINKNIPYDIEKDAGNTVYSILSELQELYMNWELFFDEEGVLKFTPIKNRNNDISWLLFEEDDNNLITSYDLAYETQNVKNKIIVWGYMNEKTGVQVKAEKSNTDIKSPFSINKLGRTIPLVISDNKIFTTEQASIRADYEIFIHNNMNDKINITCPPFYFLDVNKLVEFNIPEIELNGKFLIDDISFPLGLGEMKFTAHRIY